MLEVSNITLSGSEQFAKVKYIFRKRYMLDTCYPSTYTKNHPDFIVSYLKENFINIKGLSDLKYFNFFSFI